MHQKYRNRGPVDINHPIAGLDEANEPEKKIDVEEEKGVGEEKRVVVAP